MDQPLAMFKTQLKSRPKIADFCLLVVYSTTAKSIKLQQQIVQKSSKFVSHFFVFPKISSSSEMSVLIFGALASLPLSAEIPESAGLNGDLFLL